MDAAGGKVLVARLQITTNAWERMRGLLGRRGIGFDEGLMIERCASIHMFGMRFPIDAIFLDRALTIIKLVENLRPWRVAACPRAAHVLELVAGSSARLGLVIGMRLWLQPE